MDDYENEAYSKMTELVVDAFLDLLGFDASPNDRLDALGVDSLDMVDLAMYLEDSLGVYIDDDEIIGWETVNDVVKTAVRLEEEYWG